MATAALAIGILLFGNCGQAEGQARVAALAWTVLALVKTPDRYQVDPVR
jgi:hypothetical protein